MTKWRLNIDTWPGPDRKKWPDVRDVVRPAPGGEHVAVVYSCGEVGICKEVGLFAILRGPKDSPQLLLRPRGFLCCAFYDDGITIRWIGRRFCAVTPFHKAFNGTMYFDVEKHKVAYCVSSHKHKSESELLSGLKWSSWFWLALGPNPFRFCLIFRSVTARLTDRCTGW